MPGAGVDEDLLAGHAVAHGPPARGQAHGGRQGLHHHVLLVAEAAADVGLDDLHPAPGQAQGLGHDAPDDVGDLGGGVHHHPAVGVHEGVGAHGLDVAVLDDAGLVVALEDDFRILELGFHVSKLDPEGADDVARPVLVEEGGALLHGVLGGEHVGQHLVLDLDEVQGLLRREQVLGHHRRDGIAHEAGLVGEDQPVLDIPVPGIQGPGVPRRGELDLRQVRGGQYRHHAGQGLGLGGIDARNPGVGMGAAEDLAHQHVPLEEVVRVHGAAGDLGDGIEPLGVFSHDLVVHVAPQWGSGVPDSPAPQVWNGT